MCILCVCACVRVHIHAHVSFVMRNYNLKSLQVVQAQSLCVCAHICYIHAHVKTVCRLIPKITASAARSVCVGVGVGV